VVRKARPRHSSSSSAHHGFIYPVNGSITSPYGRRFHPVLHIWKLHDGTDFGAGCGTPIRAAYSGRVAERYFNSAYGNRLMIDHGVIAGRYVTTGYNHAQRYRVSVGEHVSKGEVIGYVGSTGLSTGCHLHFMLWLDGGRVNPMSWY
jgi:murein DD-endopeptidase MepM/ murein hydrolase activator NlpD